MWILLILVFTFLAILAINSANGKRCSGGGKSKTFPESRDPEEYHRDPYCEKFHTKAAREAERQAGPRIDNSQAAVETSHGYGITSWDRAQHYEEAVEAQENPGVWHIRIAGASHPTRVGNIERKTIYRTLVSGHVLRMVREPDNPYDFQCVCFWLDPEVGPALDVGYLPKTWAMHFAGLMDRRATFSASVQKVVSQGQNGQFVYLYVEIRQLSDPELKSRPKREAVLREHSSAQSSAI